MDKDIEMLSRAAIGILLEQTDNKMFFTDAEFNRYRGKISNIVQLTQAVDRTINACKHTHKIT